MTSQGRRRQSDVVRTSKKTDFSSINRLRAEYIHQSELIAAASRMAKDLRNRLSTEWIPLHGADRGKIVEDLRVAVETSNAGPASLSSLARALGEAIEERDWKLIYRWVVVLDGQSDPITQDNLRRWCRQNSSGLYLNEYANGKYVIHRACCSTAKRTTTRRKICATSPGALRAWLRRRGRAYASPCSKCNTRVLVAWTGNLLVPQPVGSRRVAAPQS